MSKVVIVGRPNVGKSALFNRLIGGRKAIVEDTPGITRDYIEGVVSWGGKEFVLIDTGGIVPDTEDEILRKIKDTVEKVIHGANLILFVVSGKEGVTPLDREIARLLYPYKEKVLVVVNKVDVSEEESLCGECYTLGFDRIFFVSAIHGRGVGELLDEVAGMIEGLVQKGSEEGIKLSFVGRPNTGKSSLINAILREERVLVSPKAGTTRDAVEIPFCWEGKNFTLIDTAGVRKPSRVKYGVEFFSVGRTLEAIERSDVVCLVIDGSEGVSRQDKRLAGLIYRRYKGCVIVINKMDLCALSRKEVERIVRRELFFLEFAPLVFTVAPAGEGVQELLGSVSSVYRDYTKHHRTSFVSKAVQKLMREKPPPPYRGKEVKVYYSFQEGTRPPTVVLITNSPEGWREEYRRNFLRRLREALGIKYSPLKLLIRGREKVTV